jgi:uncharacterized protein YndB with AHSA1/START domain
VTEPGTSVRIERPPERVFRYLIERNDAGWRSGVLGMRLTSGSYEGVGSTHVERRKVPGREIETRAEVVVYEPNRRWAVRRATGPVRPQVTYALEPEGDGTRLDFEFDVPMLKGTARLLDPLVRLGAPLVEKATVKVLRRLKERLVSERPDGPEYPKRKENTG